MGSHITLQHEHTRVLLRYRRDRSPRPGGRPPTMAEEARRQASQAAREMVSAKSPAQGGRARAGVHFREAPKAQDLFSEMFYAYCRWHETWGKFGETWLLNAA